MIRNNFEEFIVVNKLYQSTDIGETIILNLYYKKASYVWSLQNLVHG